MPHFELEVLLFSPLCLLVKPPFSLFYMWLITIRETSLLGTVIKTIDLLTSDLSIYQLHTARLVSPRQFDVCNNNNNNNNTMASLLCSQK